MMDSLQDILGAKNFDTPDEIEKVRTYVKDRYNSPSTAKLERGTIILSVPNSALAATLQMEREQISETFKLTNKLVIRTG
jgi:hypothetical protein